jgi:ABC-type Zn uptake system ZnuABC Zn-binding protein ZnuA
MLYKRLTLLFLLIALALPVQPAAAQGDRLQVVASFSILADVVRNVAGDAADVQSLIPVGANPHAYSPSAQDVVTLSEADVVFVAGLNFEEGLLQVLREGVGDKPYYEVPGCVPLRAISAELGDHGHSGSNDQPPDTASQPDNLDALCANHFATVQTAFGLDDLVLPGAVTRSDASYLQVLGEADPHVWTDPVNVGLWAVMIRDMLSAADPDHADVYATNTDAYLDELAALNADIQAQIDAIPQDHRYIVTNHLAFGYFAARYGLDLVGVVIPGGSTTSEPSVQDVLALIQTIQDYGVPAIFTETTVSEDLAQQVADESGAKIVRLYTGSLSEPGGDAGTYLDYMRFNAAQIAGALE